MELLYTPFSGRLRKVFRGMVQILHEPLGGWPGLFLLLGVGVLLYVTFAATFRRDTRRRSPSRPRRKPGHSCSRSES